MKILHVIANLAPRYGGPPKACMDMTQALAKKGHDVSIYTTNQDGPNLLDVPLNQPVDLNGVKVRYHDIQLNRHIYLSFPLAASLEKDIPNFDIVHIHSMYLHHNYTAAKVCRKHNIPYLIRPHGTLNPYIRKRKKWLKSLIGLAFENKNLKMASGIHFTTEDEMKLAQPYIFGQRGFIIPNGLDLQQYPEEIELKPFHQLYPELKESPYIIFLSRINFKKGLDILIKAFSQVLKGHPDLKLVIAGPDTDGYKTKVLEWMKEENLNQEVIFTGSLHNEVKNAALAGAKAFLLPSYSENFGIAVIEASACKTPVIISDEVNICYDVNKYDAGIVTKCDPNEVAQACFKILNHNNAKEFYGLNGRKMVAENFQWSAIANKLESVYEEILRERAH